MSEGIQAIIVSSDEIDIHNQIQQIALFNPDGTPWLFNITPESGAYYTLLGTVTAQQTVIDDLQDQITALAATVAAQQTNQLKVLIEGEDIPEDLPDGTIIARIPT